MIKMVVFDMAGTTVNEQNLVYHTLHHTLKEAGYQVSFEQVLLLAPGKEKLQAIKDILGGLAVTESEIDSRSQAMHQDFLGRLDQAYEAAEVQAFPGCADLFKALKGQGIKVVLNTGYDRVTADLLLNKLNWTPGIEIDLSITADDVEQGRPHPDMIMLAMEKMGIQDAKTVAKIGDSIVDIEEGKSAGVGLTMGITTGAHTAEQLASAGPDFVIDSLNQVRNLVLN